MYCYEFHVNSPLNYDFTGKFQAPSAEWIHPKVPLENYELMVPSSGVFYISYDGIKHTVKPGEYLLLPPMDNQFREGFKSSGCSFYWLHFTPNHGILKRESSMITSSVLQLTNVLIIPEHGPIPNSEKVIVLMKQLQDLIRSNYNETSVNYMTTVILCELHNQCFPKEVVSDQIKRTKQQLYQDIIDYVKRNVAMNLKVIDIARYFGYNEKYLSHVFTSIEGMSLKQFILKTKMEMANFYLTDTNNSIKEIAASLGFCDNHNFMKSYKNIMGLTPSEYRNTFSKRMLFNI